MRRRGRRRGRRGRRMKKEEEEEEEEKIKGSIKGKGRVEEDEDRREEVRTLDHLIPFAYTKTHTKTPTRILNMACSITSSPLLFSPLPLSLPLPLSPFPSPLLFPAPPSLRTCSDRSSRDTSWGFTSESSERRYGRQDATWAKCWAAISLI